MSEELSIEFIGTEEQTSEVTLADVVAELKAVRAELVAVRAAVESSGCVAGVMTPTVS